MSYDIRDKIYKSSKTISDKHSSFDNDSIYNNLKFYENGIFKDLEYIETTILKNLIEYNKENYMANE